MNLPTEWATPAPDTTRTIQAFVNWCARQPNITLATYGVDRSPEDNSGWFMVEREGERTEPITFEDRQYTAAELIALYRQDTGA